MKSNDEIELRLNEIHASLNPEQRLGATTTEGPVIVVAGAGTGKTNTLIHRVATLIEKGVAPANILIVTFTNKAAQVIQDRLALMVGDLGRHVVAGTFHSIVFNKILKGAADSQYLQEMGIDVLQAAILDDDESNKLLKEAYNNLNEDDQSVIEEMELSLRDFQHDLSSIRARGLDVDRYAASLNSSTVAGERQRILVRLWRDYEQRCRSVHGVDFDDILVFAARMLEVEPEYGKALSEQYRYLMLDEYQDTNVVQMLIMDSIARHHRNIFVVGDEKQSIYGFRGADINVILSFKKRYPDATQINMMRNYRSEPGVIKAANACAKAMQQKLSDGQLMAMNGKSDWSPKIVEFPDAETEAKIVARAIARDIRSGVPGKEIAVLYRKRSIKTELERELIEADLPFELVGDISFYQKAEVKDALAMLRFIFRPWDTLGVLRTVRASTIGISENAVKEAIHHRGMSGISFLKEQAQKRLKAKKRDEVGDYTKAAKILQPMLELAELLRECADAKEDPDKMKALLARFWDIYLRPGLIKAAKRMSSVDGVENADARIDNVAFLIERFAKGLGLGKSPDDVLEEMALMAEMVTTKMERDADQKVKLMTIHAAKGLEFEHVYLIGLDNQALGYTEETSPEEIEEERRIFYVALTRAKKKLAMSYGKERFEHGMFQQVTNSPYLEEVASGAQLEWTVFDPEPDQSEKVEHSQTALISHEPEPMHP